MVQLTEVQPTNRVRDRLNKITAEFDDAGADAAPIVFGSHRRPQAVLLSWEAFLRLQRDSDAAAAESSP
jgi:hypothetical protein